MIRRRFPRALGLAAALALAILPAFAPASPIGPATTLAADASPGLTLVGDATYDVLPDQARVAVTVKLTATNNLKDTKTKKYYYRVAYLTVLPNTSGYKLAAASGKPKVTVSSKTATYVNLKLDFGANLAAGKTRTFTLTYDIKDPGGAPDRALRISKSLVSFGAWAVAAPGSTGGSVTVRFPAGYDVLVRRGPLAGPTKDATGHDIWTTGPLAAPLDFVADLSADRPTDYVETQRTVRLAAGSATVAMQAWPDDAAWEQRVGSVVERAVPVLERLIGLPWPSGQPLQVREALVRSTGGYAGIYDPAAHRIDISYAAPDAVVIHELAHAWFNGGLVADRWIAEGFASHYADLAAKELGIDPVPVTPPDDATPPTPPTPPTPLNAWGQATPDATDAESWGYTTSLRLADAIAARAGEDALRAVWSKAARGIGGYQPQPGAEEPALGVPDWRGLLDLLEDTTHVGFADLWREWVARPEDLAVLADRASAIGYYRRSLENAGTWQLPESIRAALRAWRFDIAREQLTAADQVQAQRVTLESTARAAGVTLPGTVRTVFEGAGGPPAAATEATAEQAVVDAIAGARSARPGDVGVAEEWIIRVGLLFQHPDTDLTDAMTALAAGDLQPAYADATSAESAWRNAADAGRARILSVILLAIALFLLIGLVRRGRVPGSPGVAGARGRPGTTGTLAGHPAGTAGEAGSAGDEGAATQA
ncbi:MAG TPA: hypothetical protein VFI15_02660 [Candidatus Limnocylindrales bacterium]|nr:hypothetical protein [Candidatus Limnocylindrales bacterium]